jgi:hypothetical protein
VRDGRVQAEDEAPASEAEEALMGHTGFTNADKLIILERDGMCVPHAGSCGGDLVIHHRAGRGMGGSRKANTLANGLTVCNQWNVAAESDADLAERARVNGWKVARNGRARPEDVPVWVPWLSSWVLLTLVGDYLEVPAPTDLSG